MVTVVLCCLLHCYTYHLCCSFISGLMCIVICTMHESVFSLLTILCCRRISLQREIWSSYSPGRDAHALTHTVSYNTHALSLTYTHERALDAGPQRWAVRWMQGPACGCRAARGINFNNVNHNIAINIVHKTMLFTKQCCLQHKPCCLQCKQCCLQCQQQCCL